MDIQLEIVKANLQLGDTLLCNVVRAPHGAQPYTLNIAYMDTHAHISLHPMRRVGQAGAQWDPQHGARHMRREVWRMKREA